MIIYRCIFDIIIEPFAGMMDDDELEDELWNYVDANDLEGFRLIIEKKIYDGFLQKNIDFLNSKNIQATLFYYLFCFNEDKLIYDLKRGLTDFGDYFYIFKNVLTSIFVQISENIGHTDIECSEFIEDTNFSQDVFKNWEEELKYINS